MKILYYRLASGKSPINKYLEKKGPNFKLAFNKKIFQLQNNPGLIKAELIRDGIYELKIWPLGDVSRPLYVTIDGGDMLILHVVEHLDGKAEDAAVDTSIERFKDWKARNP